MSSFRQRIYDHEVKPPADGWEKLSAALDAGRQHEFPSRLYDTELPPPPAVWDRIAASLDNESPVLPVPEERRTRVIPLFLRYAAAAVVLAAVATTAFFALTDNGDGQVMSAQVASAPPVLPAAPAPQLKDSGNNLPSRSESVTDAVASQGLAGTQDEEPASGNDTRSRVVQVAYAPRRVSPLPEELPSAQYQNPLYAYEGPAVDIAERYVTLMTPDGAFIRMSKKLGPLVCCVTGQEQDDQCRSQIRRLQQELATSPVGQGNVLDVLDMVNSLNTGTGL